MRRRSNGHTVTYDRETDSQKVTFFPSGEQITGTDAKKFLRKRDFKVRVLTVAFFPLTIAFAVLVGIHHATGWVIDKVFNS